MELTNDDFYRILVKINEAEEPTESDELQEEIDDAFEKYEALYLKTCQRYDELYSILNPEKSDDQDDQSQ